MEYVIEEEARKALDRHLKKARQQRQTQVRKQSQQWTDTQRRRFDEEKERQMRLMAEAITAEAEEHARARIEHLLMTHDLAMNEVGAAHRAAQQLREQEKLRELKRLQSQMLAQERGSAALNRQREIMVAKDSAASETQRRREQVRKEEDKRVKERIALSKVERRPLSNIDSSQNQQRQTSKPAWNFQAKQVPFRNSKTSAINNSKSLKSLTPSKRKTGSSSTPKKSNSLYKTNGAFDRVAKSKMLQMQRTQTRLHSRSPVKRQFNYETERIKSLPVESIQNERQKGNVRYSDSRYPIPENQYVAPEGLVEKHVESGSPDAWEKAAVANLLTIEELEERAKRQEEMVRRASERGTKAMRKAILDKQLQAAKNELMSSSLENQMALMKPVENQSALDGKKEMESHSKGKSQEAISSQSQENVLLSDWFPDSSSEIEDHQDVSKLLKIKRKSSNNQMSYREEETWRKIRELRLLADDLSSSTKISSKDSKILHDSTQYESSESTMTDSQAKSFAQSSDDGVMNNLEDLSLPPVNNLHSEHVVDSSTSDLTLQDLYRARIEKNLPKDARKKATLTKRSTVGKFGNRANHQEEIASDVSKSSNLKKVSQSSKSIVSTHRHNSLLDEMIQGFTTIPDSRTENVKGKKQTQSSKLQPQSSSSSLLEKFVRSLTSTPSSRTENKSSSDRSLKLKGPLTSTPNDDVELKRPSKDKLSMGNLAQHPSKKELILDHYISELFHRRKESIELLPVSSSSSSDLKIDSLSVIEDLNNLTKTEDGSSNNQATSSDEGTSSSRSTKSASSVTWKTILEEQTMMVTASSIDANSDSKTNSSNNSKNPINSSRSHTSGSTLGEVYVKTILDSPDTAANSSSGNSSNSKFRGSTTDKLNKETKDEFSQMLNEIESEILLLQQAKRSQVSPSGTDEPTRDITLDFATVIRNPNEESMIVRDNEDNHDKRNRTSSSGSSSRGGSSSAGSGSGPEKETKRQITLNEFIGDFSYPSVHADEGLRSHAEIVTSIFEELKGEWANIMRIERPSWSS